MGLTMLMLAFLTHLSLPALLLVPPIILLLLGRPESSLASPKTAVVDRWKATRLALEYILYVAALSLVATVASGGWDWPLKTWGTGYASFIVESKSPNDFAVLLGFFYPS